jgi:hypothetical protein
MKVFWWQCGLHIEPENKEESAALQLLVDGIKMTSIGAVNGSLQATSVLGEQCTEIGSADHEILTSTSAGTVEQLADQ